MKMVVLDGFTLNPGDLDWGMLEAYGPLTVYASSAPEEVAARIGDAEVAFVNKAVVDEAVLAQCPQLKYIGVLATGFDNVDVEAARRAGVAVSNVPDYGGIAVAQHTMALLLALSNRVGYFHQRVGEGAWRCTTAPAYGEWEMSMTELNGKTIGFVGLGTIAIYAAHMARAFGMRVLGYSRSERAEGRAVAEYVDLDTLLRESDVVSLHLPLNDGSRHIIGEGALAKMKPGAFLLNTARGALIDEAALVRALDSGRLGGFAADVMEKEPFDANHPLMGRENVVFTPHIAWGPRDTRARLLQIVVENFQAFLDGRRQNRLD